MFNGIGQGYYATNLSEVTNGYLPNPVPTGVWVFELSTGLTYIRISSMWQQLGYLPPGLAFGNPARAINSIFQPSATRDTEFTYAIPVALTSTLLAGASVTFQVKYADSIAGGVLSGNIVALPPVTLALSGVLATETQTAVLTGIIPAGKQAEIIQVTNSGSPSVGTVGTQEVQS